jgi:hypothetical protein
MTRRGEGGGTTPLIKKEGVEASRKRAFPCHRTPLTYVHLPMTTTDNDVSKYLAKVVQGHPDLLLPPPPTKVVLNSGRSCPPPAHVRPDGLPLTGM